MAGAEAIYILSRNNYNNFSDKGNNIFFVRENSSETSDMVSLYVGEAKQTDVVIINGDDLWDSVTNNVNLGSNTVDYQVQGKLLLVEKEVPTVTDQQETTMKTVYSAMTYDTEQGKFIDCGIPNNVIVVGNDWSTSDTSVGVKDFIYIQKSTGAIYQFDGTQYVEVISPSTLNVDNVTIAKSAQNVISVIASGIADGSTITASSNKLKVSTSGIVDNDTTGVDSNGKIKVSVSGLADNSTIETDANSKLKVKTSGIVDGATTDVDSNGKIKAGINLTTGKIMPTTAFGTGEENVLSGTDVPLATVISTATASGDFSETYLPRNGCEFRISGNVNTISIGNISTMRTSDGSTAQRTNDYLSVIVAKTTTGKDVSTFVKNFATSGYPKIYLMNPDVDISAYTVIHILLYFDGFNMCAIVTGYAEESSP